MTKWLFPIKNWKGEIPQPPHLGAFGAVRKFHCHEGVDLYAAEGTPVRAVEFGKIMRIAPFTGPQVDMPWWNDTDCVMVLGNTGVVNYGEITPHKDLRGYSCIRRGDIVGYVKQVLKKDKGRPMSMLHVELYDFDCYEWHGWGVGEEKPAQLRDPTPFLLDAEYD